MVTMPGKDLGDTPRYRCSTCGYGAWDRNDLFEWPSGRFECFGCWVGKQGERSITVSVADLKRKRE